jgi:hypothetical protein
MCVGGAARERIFVKKGENLLFWEKQGRPALPWNV